MGKQKAVSLTHRQDVRYYVDYLPWWLAVDADQSEAEFLLAEAAEEPAAILKAYRGKVGLNHLDARLILAAEDFLEVLSALRDRLAEGEDPLPLPLEHDLREAALGFVGARDRVEAMSVESARRRGGKTTASQRLAEKAALHTEIRKEAARLRGGYLRREATGILARKFNLSPSQIRRIMKQKT